MVFPFPKYPCTPYSMFRCKRTVTSANTGFVQLRTKGRGKKGQDEGGFKTSLTTIVETFCSPLEITHP